MGMKAGTIAGLAALLVALGGGTAAAGDDIERHRDCVRCGMDRKAYGYSRMLVLFRDGDAAGVCSLHCAVVEIDREPRREVASLLVADRDTRQLIDAGAAVWVLGGRKPGVMTARPKWAFASRDAALAFVREYGGDVVPWSEALAAARGEISPAAAPAPATPPRAAP